MHVSPLWRLSLALLAVLAGLAGSDTARAQATEIPAIVAAAPQGQEQRRAGIADAARELSLLEAARDYPGLYARLHPDSRVTVPFAAFAGWYDAVLAGKTTAELTVLEINFIDWTWGVNGRTYPDTAQVRFTQPYWVNGERSDVENVFHLVEADGEWYWFFGGSQGFIDEQIARYTPELAATTVDAVAARAARFPDSLHAHVDEYWATQFAAADRTYVSPVGVVGFDDPLETACGVADPVMEAAFYCVLDQTIYYSTDFRQMVERQIGDYGWVVVVAHEWGHHVQLMLGNDLVGALDQTGSLAPVELEQQADCLAGAYTQSAELVGWLDASDVSEAIHMTSLSGDPIGTSWGDPNAHGTGEERVAAFLTGYERGMLQCDLHLTAP